MIARVPERPEQAGAEEVSGAVAHRAMCAAVIMTS
jgi:hypothetical protein